MPSSAAPAEARLPQADIPGEGPTSHPPHKASCVSHSESHEAKVPSDQTILGFTRHRGENQGGGINMS